MVNSYGTKPSEGISAFPSEGISALIGKIGKKVEKNKMSEVSALCQQVFSNYPSFKDEPNGYRFGTNLSSWDYLQDLGILTMYKEIAKNGDINKSQLQTIIAVTCDIGLQSDTCGIPKEQSRIHETALELLDILFAGGIGANEVLVFLEKKDATLPQLTLPMTQFSLKVLGNLWKYYANLNDANKEILLKDTTVILMNFYKFSSENDEMYIPLLEKPEIYSALFENLYDTAYYQKDVKNHLNNVFKGYLKFVFDYKQDLNNSLDFLIKLVEYNLLQIPFYDSDQIALNRQETVHPLNPHDKEAIQNWLKIAKVLIKGNFKNPNKFMTQLADSLLIYDLNIRNELYLQKHFEKQLSLNKINELLSTEPLIIESNSMWEELRSIMEEDKKKKEIPSTKNIRITPQI